MYINEYLILKAAAQQDVATREQTKAISEWYLADVRYRFQYLIPHPDQDLANATWYQGATPGLINTADLLSLACTLPADIREVFASWKSILLLRTNGRIRHRIIPIEFSALQAILQDAQLFPFPFRCVLSNQTSCDFVDQQLSGKDGWLHLRQSRVRRAVLNANVRTNLTTYVDNQLSVHADKVFVDACREAMSSRTAPGVRRISLRAVRHNLTLPNETALRAFGCLLDDNDALTPRHGEACGRLDYQVV